MKVISKALRACFQRIIQRRCPVPVGSMAHDRHVGALEGDLLVGEVPAGLDGSADPGVDRLHRVVQTTLRISTSKARKGTNSTQAFSHSRTIAGYRWTQASQDSRNRSIAAASAGAV